MENDIKLAISRNKINGAKALIRELLANQHKAEWTQSKQEEYDALYKTKVIASKVFDVQDSYIDEDGEYISVFKDEYSFDYDDNAPTFNDWLNETRVVNEAIEAVLDEDGNIVEPAIAEVTELVRPYMPVEITDETVLEKLCQYDEYKAYLKAKKNEALDTITVEVNGKMFDGNETARNNMLASIQASSVVGIESTYWKLADNNVAEVTVDELKEALAKSIQEVGRIVVGE